MAALATTTVRRAADTTAHRHVNINSMARGSSYRLASTLNANLADAILREKGTNGDFSSFADLKERIYGLGDKKIDKLKAAGFHVATRGGRGGAAAAEVVRDNSTLRDPGVSRLYDQVFRHRSDRDLYTKLTQRRLEKAETATYGKPTKGQVDHVWECQVLERANNQAREGRGLYTRGVDSVIKGFVNAETNLNVTTCDVNQKKKGPFMLWLRAQDRGEGGALDDFRVPQELRDPGHWARIEQSVVKVYDELETNARDLRDARAREHAELLLGEMNSMMTRMDLG